MARYNLIIKDSTHEVLIREARRQGISFGKLINNILDRVAEDFRKAEKGENDPVPGEKNVCIFCGRATAYEGHGEGGQKLLVCKNHKYFLKGMKEVRELER